MNTSNYVKFKVFKRAVRDQLHQPLGRCLMSLDEGVRALTGREVANQNRAVLPLNVNKC